jgi:alpha-N-acetylglucosamine transferase
MSKSTIGSCQELVLSINRTRGKKTTSANCIEFVTVNCSHISQGKSRQVRLVKQKEMQKNKSDQVSKTKEMQKKIDYLHTERLCLTEIGTTFS